MPRPRCGFFRQQIYCSHNTEHGTIYDLSLQIQNIRESMRERETIFFWETQNKRNTAVDVKPTTYCCCTSILLLAAVATPVTEGLFPDHPHLLPTAVRITTVPSILLSGVDVSSRVLRSGRRYLRACLCFELIVHCFTGVRSLVG